MEATVNAADHAALAQLLARGLDEGEVLRRFAVVRPGLDSALVTSNIKALAAPAPRSPERNMRSALADFSLLVTADPPATPVSSERALLVKDFSGIEDLRAGLSDLGWTDTEIAEVVIYCEHVRATMGFFANARQHDDLVRQITTTRGPAVDRGWPYSSEQIAQVVRGIGWRMYTGPLTALNERLDSTGFTVDRAHWTVEGTSSWILFIGDGTIVIGDGTIASRFSADASATGLPS